MTTNEHPHFAMKLDRRLITERGGVRHLLVDVAAPEIPRPDEDTRPPLDLALVIDASGSMSGPPLDAAKRAAGGVVEALGSRDRVTVVSFADDVLVHVATLAMIDGGRERALSAIDDLVTHGCTDLCGGWRGGVEALTTNELPGAQRRVVILSDGHANRGVTDPEQLGLEAAAAREQGVYTTAVGIGDGYSTTQLSALSEHGGGCLHHAARPEEIIEVVVGELGQILQTAMEGLVLHLDLPSAVSAQAVGPFPTRRVADGMAVDMGTLVSSATRRVVVRLFCPPMAEGDQLGVIVTPSWRVPGDDRTIAGKPMSLAVLYAPVEEVATEVPDTRACLDIAVAWQQELILQATVMVEEGDREGAKSFLDEARHGLLDYVKDLPGGKKAIFRVEQYRRRLDRTMSPGLAKEVSCMMMRESTNRAELRDSGGMAWDEIDQRD